jgi:hypothetical protein
VPSAALGALVLRGATESAPQVKGRATTVKIDDSHVELVDYEELKTQMNDAERDWCPTPGTSFWHRLRRAPRGGTCLTAYVTDAVEANKKATDCPPDICENGNEQNAVQHCLWSAYMTSDLGEDLARGFLTRHEAGADPNSTDHLNDLANNEIGIGIVKEIAVDAYMAGGKPDEVRVLIDGRCNDRARSNQLVFSPF